MIIKIKVENNPHDDFKRKLSPIVITDVTNEKTNKLDFPLSSIDFFRFKSFSTKLYNLVYIFCWLV